jgi:hypothetical protein
MIRPLEAWTIRRLLCGESVNGELQAISEPFRRLAAHLDGLDVEARQRAWGGFLCGQSDADTLMTVRQAMSVRDEGRSLGAGLRRQAPNHLERLGSRALVVSVQAKGTA